MRHSAFVFHLLPPFARTDGLCHKVKTAAGLSVPALKHDPKTAAASYPKQGDELCHKVKTAAASYPKQGDELCHKVKTAAGLSVPACET